MKFRIEEVTLRLLINKGEMRNLLCTYFLSQSNCERYFKKSTTRNTSIIKSA